jgi:hypothetical protein
MGTHFDISYWTDFARGVTPEPARVAMEAHLASCPSCRATLDVVSGVIAAARAEARYEPPDHAVRAAKALGSLLSRAPSRASSLIPRLVYDSVADLAPAGVRGGEPLSRHTVHEAGDFSLDLRIEQEKGTPTVTIVGQLTNRKDPEAPVAGAPVLLFAEEAVVAHAVYNRFGEFFMQGPSTRELRLSVALDPPSSRLDLPLDPLIGTARTPKIRRSFKKS